MVQTRVSEKGKACRQMQAANKGLTFRKNKRVSAAHQSPDCQESLLK